jgi:regulatory protein YycH of two-component signal transduction system YycFG
MKRSLRLNKLIFLIIVPVLLISNVTFIILYSYSQQEITSLTLANDDLNKAINSLMYKSPEALAACADKSENATCSFISTDNTILGSCKNIGEQLTCVSNVE